MSKRPKLIELVKKLRAKGENAATTEAEAEAFLEKASKLIEEYDISETELERAGISAMWIEKKGIHVNVNKAHPATSTFPGIEVFAGVKVALITRKLVRPDGSWREAGYMSVAGRPDQVELADYLFDQMRNIIDAAWDAERERRLALVGQSLYCMGLSTAHIARRSYQFGMAHRLSARLKAMSTRQAARDTALPVLVAAMDETKKFEQGAVSPIDYADYARGHRDGDKVQLGTGIETDPLNQKVLK